MTVNAVEIDPTGDTLVILSSKNAPNCTQQTSNPKGLKTAAEQHFRCSKTHLASASRRAYRMFTSNFKEALPEKSDGLHHWKFEAIFDPKAFEIVMKIIHGKTRDIPTLVKIDLLAEISAVVDDLECHDSVWFFSRLWMSNLNLRAPQTFGRELFQCILISFVFEDATLFRDSTRTAILCSSDTITISNLPIRPKVLDTIEEQRQNALEKLFERIYELEKALSLRSNTECSIGCRLLLLGSLVSGLKQNLLYDPRPVKPFKHISFERTSQLLQKIESMPYFGPTQECGKDNCLDSSTWTKGGYSFPTSLVQHKCNIQRRIKTLLSAIDEQLEGLKLSEYL